MRITKLFSRPGPLSAKLFAAARRWLDWLHAVQNRERARLLEELIRARGLMPLLMKRRNGYRWSREEKQQIRAQLRSLSEISPYLVPLLLPGGFLLLPVLAWWLDRRRQKRADDAQWPEH